MFSCSLEITALHRHCVRRLAKCQLPVLKVFPSTHNRSSLSHHCNDVFPFPLETGFSVDWPSTAHVAHLLSKGPGSQPHRLVVLWDLCPNTLSLPQKTAIDPCKPRGEGANKTACMTLKLELQIFHVTKLYSSCIFFFLTI